MRYLTGFAAIIVLLTVTSCKKLTQFHFDYTSQAVFPANIPVGIPLSINTPPVTTNSEQTFQNNNTRKDLVKTISLDQITLTVTSPANQSLSFLQNISVYISTDSLPEVLVASKTVPANVGGTLSLDPTNVDLKPYIMAPQIKIRVSGTTDQLVTQDVNVNVYTRFLVQANLLALF